MLRRVVLVRTDVSEECIPSIIILKSISELGALAVTSSKQRMVSSGLLRRVALVRTDVSEEPGASFLSP
jgi:hypothetical protein